MGRAGVGARHHLVCSLSLFFRESISAQIVLPGQGPSHRVVSAARGHFGGRHIVINTPLFLMPVAKMPLRGAHSFRTLGFYSERSRSR